MTPTTTAPADMTPPEAQAMLAGLPPVEDMDAAAIMAELADTLAAPIDTFEAALKAMWARRLDLWCAARLLPKDASRGPRPIFMALAEASGRSEALVIKSTKRAFTARGIDPPR